MKKGGNMIITRKIKLFSSDFNRSEHMKQLHAQGRYAGTSKIGQWNVSEDKRVRMAELRSKNALDKNSRGYGSEYHMRLANRDLLFNKFQGEEGYFYFLDFPESIKCGFSKDWERRTTKQILGGRTIMIISGPTKSLADLEFDVFMKFQKYTKLNSEGTRYTEFMEKRVKSQVYKFIEDYVSKHPELKYEVKTR